MYFVSDKNKVAAQFFKLTTMRHFHLSTCNMLIQNNMHQNDAIFRFPGYFSLLELLRSVGYIFPCAGKKNIQFMTDLREFFSKIHKVEYFDSTLVRLSIQDLEKIAIQFEDQMKEILIGENCDC